MTSSVCVCNNTCSSSCRQVFPQPRKSMFVFISSKFRKYVQNEEVQVKLQDLWPLYCVPHAFSFYKQESKGYVARSVLPDTSGDPVGTELIVTGILRNKSMCVENCRRKLQEGTVRRKNPYLLHFINQHAENYMAILFVFIFIGLIQIYPNWLSF